MSQSITVWTDVVPPDCKYLITPLKRYEVTGEIKEGTSMVQITPDTGGTINILICRGCAFLDNNQWNIES